MRMERTRKSLEPLSKLEGMNVSISAVMVNGDLKTVIVKL